jgi:hypothetical protein
MYTNILNCKMLELKLEKIKKNYEFFIDIASFKLQNIIDSDIEIKEDLFEMSNDQAKFYAYGLKLYNLEFKNYKNYEIPKIPLIPISDDIEYIENENDFYTQKDFECFVKDAKSFKSIKNIKSTKNILNIINEEEENEEGESEQFVVQNNNKKLRRKKKGARKKIKKNAGITIN